jgi:hypothetical protein
VEDQGDFGMPENFRCNASHDDPKKSGPTVRGHGHEVCVFWSRQMEDFLRRTAKFQPTDCLDAIVAEPMLDSRQIRFLGLEVIDAADHPKEGQPDGASGHEGHQARQDRFREFRSIQGHQDSQWIPEFTHRLSSRATGPASRAASMSPSRFAQHFLNPFISQGAGPQTPSLSHQYQARSCAATLTAGLAHTLQRHWARIGIWRTAKDW